MKKTVISLLTLCLVVFSYGQSIDEIINPGEVKRIETILAADDMQGRRTFTPGIEKASAFIEDEFKKAGLQTFNGAANFRQEFFMYESKTSAAKVVIDGKEIPDSVLAVFSYQPKVSLTEKNDIEVVKIKAGDSDSQSTNIN